MIGKLLKNRRVGQAGLAWSSPNWTVETALALTGPDFAHETAIPTVYAARRVDGENLSPAPEVGQVPADAAQLLLVVEDPDAPMPMPYNHGIALLDPSMTGLAQGALAAENPALGVRLLNSGSRRGYLGSAPIKGHGPHRYVFQLFPLAQPLIVGTSKAVRTPPSHAR
ncbi:YbhB/YbcL family Raf kinase inhibitor-like protein [Streptomyces sp. NPDC046759]|uniref:YbhB/YbcL family Raf kinase inhibitor-like protein n=1 Tax=Streptomyces sp. NPDC046759 TaxID=3155019 RepID=UPI0033FC7A72